MHWTLRALAVSVAGVLLAACGGDDTPEATTDLAVTATDGLAFDPDGFSVPAGEEVTVTLTSAPAVEHDLVVEGAGAVGMVGEAGHGDAGDHAMDEDHSMGGDDLHVAHANAGETVTATFTIDEPGEYRVYCSVPGHRQGGMETTLTVVDGS